MTASTGNSVVMHWTGSAWRAETNPAVSSLFRLVVLPDNQLFSSDAGTIFRCQFSG